MPELNMQEMIKVKNLAGWDVSFPRIFCNGANDTGVNIKRNNFVMLSRAEINAQFDAQNVHFVGEDGKGKRARVYVENKDCRIYAGFENAEGTVKQDILTDDKIREMFEIKAMTAFEEEVKGRIVTDAEKEKIVSAIKRLGLNDFKKIQFIEKYTGYTVES